MILVDLEKVSREQLAELIEEAWRELAPARLRTEYDAGATRRG